MNCGYVSFVYQIGKFRPIQLCGDISYSLYLWHFVFSCLIIPRVYTKISDNPYFINHRLFICGITLFLLTMFSYCIIERLPSVRLISHKKFGNAFFLSILAVTLFCIILLPSQRVQSIAESIPDTRAIHFAVENDENACLGAQAVVNMQCGNPFGERNPEFVMTKYFGVAETELRKKLDIPKYWYAPCSIQNQETPKTPGDLICTLGDPNGAKSMLLTGNSHAIAYADAFDILGKQNHIMVLYTAGMSGYANPLCVDENRDQIWKDRSNYILSELSKRVDTVVLAQEWDRELSGVSGLSGRDLSNSCSGTNIADAVKELVKSTHARIAVMQDVPQNMWGFPDCINFNTKCNYLLTNQLLNQMNSSKNLLDENGLEGQFDYIPVEDAFCHDGECHNFIGGLQVFFDGNHLTSAFSETLEPFIEKEFQSLSLL